MPLGSLPELVKSPSVVTELASERTAAPLGAGRSGMLRAGAALAAIAVLGTVVFVRRQGQAEAASEPVLATPAKAPVQAPPPPAPSPTKVSLSLHVMPRDAKLFLDGAPLAGNPFEGDAERDESSHVVTARAEGYQSRSFTVTFDRDVQVHAELPPAPRATEASPPRARSGSAPAAAHPPSGRTAPRRTIDEDDPYHP